MEDLQSKVDAILETRIAEGRDRGIQAVIYHQGELIVDTWAGIADVRNGRKVDGDTLFPVFSVSKGITATLAHRLAERGQLDYGKPISHYWPEFGVAGKEAITVGQALDHTAGLPQMPADIDQEVLCDWKASCQAMARTTPFCAPGSRQIYHAVTFGWMVGGVVVRVDGRPIAQMLKEEIGDPLGIRDMYMGIPDEVESRVAWLEELFEKTPASPPAEKKAEPGPVTVSPFMVPLCDWMNRDDSRRACVPASNGIMSARAIARHYAALLPGGVDGVELLSPERVRIARERRFPKVADPDQESAMRMSLGYQLSSVAKGGDESLTAFGHDGYGGSMAFADPAHELAFCVTRNFFTKESPATLILDEVRRSLGIPAGSVK